MRPSVQQQAFSHCASRSPSLNCFSSSHLKPPLNEVTEEVRKAAVCRTIPTSLYPYPSVGDSHKSPLRTSLVLLNVMPKLLGCIHTNTHLLRRLQSPRLVVGWMHPQPDAITLHVHGICCCERSIFRVDR